jgi:hypothetical protein
MIDRQMLRFARQVRARFLGRGKPDGKCFAVAAPLCALLTMVGVRTTLVQGRVVLRPRKPGAPRQTMSHFWVSLSEPGTKLAREVILDPTADQLGLGLPPVYLGRLPFRYVPDPAARRLTI